MSSFGCVFRRILIAVLLIVILGIPVLRSVGLIKAPDGVDSTSSATLVLPEQPSGEFLCLINTELHKETLSDWEKFFSGEELPVIFDDISCIASESDVNGIQLAERFQLQLPENQMALRTEVPTLLISKAEEGFIDVAVISKEMADALCFDASRLKDDIKVISVSGA